MTQGPLLSNPQAIDQASVSLEIVFLEIIEKPSPLPHKLKEAPAGVVILHMNLEVPRKMIDTLTQKGHLYLRRPSIALVEFELLNNLPPLFLSNSHVSSVFFSFSFCYQLF